MRRRRHPQRRDDQLQLIGRYLPQEFEREVNAVGLDPADGIARHLRLQTRLNLTHFGENGLGQFNGNKSADGIHDLSLASIIA